MHFSCTLPLALLLAFGSGPERAAQTAPQAGKIPSRLSEMFAHARRHETEQVLRFKPEVERSGDRTWEIGYRLALYIASPEKYERDFVEHFPVDGDGVMRILYERIELPKLTPGFLFSFEALGKIAAKGDPRSIQRLLECLGSAEGAVGESLCGSLQKVLSQQLERAVKVMATLPPERRQKISSCCSGWDPVQLQRLESSLTTMKSREGSSPEQRTCIQELLVGIRAAETSRRGETQGDSGIEGIALIGPTRPSVRVGDETPDEVPYPTKLQVLDAAGKSEVARAESGKDGRFRIALPPGEYLVRQVQEPGERYPLEVEVPVRVEAGKYASVTLHLDSGLR